MAAKIVLVDRGLAVYGSEAQGCRDLLRRVAEGISDQLCPNEQHSSADSPGPKASPVDVFEAIERLSPKHEIQTAIKSQVVGLLMQIGEECGLINQDNIFFGCVLPISNASGRYTRGEQPPTASV